MSKRILPETWFRPARVVRRGVPSQCPTRENMVVMLYDEEGKRRTLAQLAQRLGVRPQTVHKWLLAYQLIQPREG